MSTTDSLDADIVALKARIATLHAHRANLASILLSQPHLSTRLQTASHPLVTQQTIRNTSNIYRACAGVTAYKVLDPDPYALNGGAVLGLSIDVSLQGKFIETYHVLLSVHAKEQEQGETPAKVLRVHKHTIPPCIPLLQLVNKWLPVSDKDGAERMEQDLVRFGRSLRRELVGWHLRVDALAALRKEVGVEGTRRWGDGAGEALEKGQVLNAFVSEDEDASSDAEEEEEGEEERGAVRITDLEADAAVRQMTVVWSDRRTALLSVTKDGSIEKAVCRAKDGSRDVALSRKAIGPMTGLVRRLAA